ncbi:MAG: DeoR/GlpR transcriptional regulator [Anaerolineales bacterium]|nr:DeoR/GlpR transcriptional regulator [Anaerolineales bacterium]
MAIPTERQAKIVDWLHEDNSLTIKVLAERLDVSLMTVHRDLDKLTREGIVRKVHGGVMLAPQAMQTNALENRCQLCRGRVPNRTAFTLTTKAGERADACCPHCGLMLLQQIEEVSSALTVDYLYGRRVNVYRAIFVIDSDVRVCCIPSVLCFAAAEDAIKFQKGFGGKVTDLTQAQQHLLDSHLHMTQN